MENLPLVRDLVSWIAVRPRAYDEVMDTWRTSCPRLTIWEDAVDAGLVKVRFDNEAGKVVSVTQHGREFLNGCESSADAPAPGIEEQSPDS